MGATVCRAVTEEDELELVGAIDPVAAGRPLGEVTAAAGSLLLGQAAYLQVAGEPADLAAGQVDVAIDFTAIGPARENLAWCAEAGVHAVCGTTGFGAEDIEQLKELFGREDGPNCVLAPNFSIGAVLMMRCAELCAPYFEGAEVIELHHERKKDAPSGTSLETARRMSTARAAADAGAWVADPTEVFSLEGARGALGEGGIHVHSVRLPGLVAHQEVIFGAPGETFSLRHDSTDRGSFMPGVILAAKKVGELPGLTVGLEKILGL
jgi:4-hydroxy-tetrahydrodipicolinate reductase